jgi:hypothetical protein
MSGHPRLWNRQGSSRDSATFSSAKHRMLPSSYLQVGQRLCTLSLQQEHSVCPLGHCTDISGYLISDFSPHPQLSFPSLIFQGSWRLLLLPLENKNELMDGVGGCCCCYNDAPPLPPQSQQNKLSRDRERGKNKPPPQKKLKEKIKDWVPDE